MSRSSRSESSLLFARRKRQLCVWLTQCHLQHQQGRFQRTNQQTSLDHNLDCYCWAINFRVTFVTQCFSRLITAANATQLAR